MATAVSGRGHKDGESNLAALFAHLEQLRSEARQQRKAASLQRDRLRATLAACAVPKRSAPDGRDESPFFNHDDAAASASVVAIAASAGGLLPLAAILDGLPAHFQAGVLVALHTGETSTLPAVLQRHCRLAVKAAEQGDVICDRTVYIAPPLAHLIVNANRRMSVVYKERRHFARPSADWLFDTIAATYGDASIAVVLSGYQRDGARGVVLIRRAGGSVIAQDPDTCRAPDMPTAAIRTGCVSWILRPEMMARVIVDRVHALAIERRTGEFDNPFAASA